jgi:hypothetical protein
LRGIFAGKAFIIVNNNGRNSPYLHKSLARLLYTWTYYPVCLHMKYPVPHRTEVFFINEILMSRRSLNMGFFCRARNLPMALMLIFSAILMKEKGDNFYGLLML